MPKTKEQSSPSLSPQRTAKKKMGSMDRVIDPALGQLVELQIAQDLGQCHHDGALAEGTEGKCVLLVCAAIDRFLLVIGWAAAEEKTPPLGGVADGHMGGANPAPP